MDRTVRIRLKPTPEQAQALAETTAQFTAAFNAVCKEGWRRQEGNAFNLHRFTYRDVKDALPALVSDLHIQARQKASEAVKSALTRQKHGRKTGCPHSDVCPPRYNLHTFTLNWAAATVRLSTTRKKQSIAFHLPPYASYALGCPVATADLICKKGKWYLHVVVVVDDVPFVDNGQAIGVDMGVCRPAVTSDGRLHGKKRWREVSNKRFRLKRKLQSNGSKSAKRHLRRLAGRQQRFRRDCDHVLSKRILEGVASGTTVVIENLTDIRSRVRVRHGESSRRLHSWSFAQLRSFLVYKAEDRGARVIGIDPRHTSQRCNVCGHIYRGNRPSQSRFICRKCGHKANPDVNAAKNVRDKHLVGWSSPSDALPPTSVSSRSSDQGQAVSFTGR